MKVLLVSVSLFCFSNIIYCQSQDTLKDCNCIIRGECIQYLDSMFMPVSKQVAVYMRYNYKFSEKNYAIIETKGVKTIIEVFGNRYIKDTIIFLDGIYKFFNYGKLQYETHYKNGYPIKFITYWNTKDNRTEIIDYSKTYNDEKWTCAYEEYLFGKIIYRKFYRYNNEKLVSYKKERFKIEYPE